MNNNYARSPSIFILSIALIFGYLPASAPASAADSGTPENTNRYSGAIPAKNTQFSKVSGDLLQLQTEFETYRAERPKITKTDPFTPQMKLLRTAGDYVVVDAVAAGDAEALKSDLLGLGAVNVSTHRSVVSARVPIMS